MKENFKHIPKSSKEFSLLITVFKPGCCKGITCPPLICSGIMSSGASTVCRPGAASDQDPLTNSFHIVYHLESCGK